MPEKSRTVAGDPRRLWQRVAVLWVCWSLAAAVTDMYVPHLPSVTALLACLAFVGVWVLTRWHPGPAPKGVLWSITPLIPMSWLLLFSGFSETPIWVAGLAIALSLVGIAVSRRWLWVGPALTLVAISFLLISYASWGGRAPIDVIGIMQNGALDLLRGVNPYFQHFRSTTTGVDSFYYPYGPFALLLAVPFAWVGDVRLLSVASACSIVILPFVARRWERPTVAAAMMLALSPWLVWPILEAWNELTVVALLLWWQYLAGTEHRYAWPLVGVAVGVNPVALIAIAPIYLLQRNLRWDVARGVVLGGVIYGATVALVGLQQAGRVVHTQGSVQFPATLGAGGVVAAISGHPLTVIPSAAMLILILLITWRFRRALGRYRDLGAGVSMLLLVLVLPVSYFEYALLPSIWIWWWLIEHMQPTAEPEQQATNAVALP
ncbi:MAG: hypothetical protein ACRENY_09790 [Candidatus Dormibacteria bacterium]